MWRELSNLMRRYYEGDKKYTTRVFRNNNINCEMNVVGVYSNKKSTFLIVLYPLNESSETIKTYGPTTIKLALDDEKIANGIINFVRKNLTESPPNFDKISKSKFSSYIVDE